MRTACRLCVSVLEGARIQCPEVCSLAQGRREEKVWNNKWSLEGTRGVAGWLAQSPTPKALETILYRKKGHPVPFAGVRIARCVCDVCDVWSVRHAQGPSTLSIQYAPIPSHRIAWPPNLQTFQSDPSPLARIPSPYPLRLPHLPTSLNQRALQCQRASQPIQAVHGPPSTPAWRPEESRA